MSKNNNYSFNLNLYKKIGKELHMERIRRGKTLRKVSAELNLPAEALDRMELGILGFSRNNMFKLADYYGKVIRFYLKDRE